MLDILAYRKTETGWRALTAAGEVLDVRGRNGAATLPAGEIKLAGEECKLPARPNVRLFDEYVARCECANRLFEHNDNTAALREINKALTLASTARARFTRSLILLALGRWDEGIAGYEERFAIGNYPAIARMRTHGVPPWRGESLDGKTLLLIHDEGFGDTIQMLRYVPRLTNVGATVALLAPPALTRLASTVVPMILEEWRPDVMKIDYFCSVMSLWKWLKEKRHAIPRAPYLRSREEWQTVLVRDTRKRHIGIAWSVGHELYGDFPRSIPLEILVCALAGPDVELHSVQLQEAEAAEIHGVKTWPFRDFAECAGLMAQMDAIVSIDTAALHLAGAIGHPRVHALLSHWHSWRWKITPPLYPQITLHCQRVPGDWPSALASLSC